MRLQLDPAFLPDLAGDPWWRAPLRAISDPIDLATLALPLPAGIALATILATEDATPSPLAIWTWDGTPGENATWREDLARLRLLLEGAALDVPDEEAQRLLTMIEWQLARYLEHRADAQDDDRETFWALAALRLAMIATAPTLTATTTGEPPAPPDAPHQSAPLDAPWWVPCARPPIARCTDIERPATMDEASTLATAPHSHDDVLDRVRQLVAFRRTEYDAAPAPDPQWWWDLWGDHPIVLATMRRADLWRLPAGPMPEGEPREALALAQLEIAYPRSALWPAILAGSMLAIALAFVGEPHAR